MLAMPAAPSLPAALQRQRRAPRPYISGPHRHQSASLTARHTPPRVPPQACLSTKAKPGSKAALRVRVTEEGESLLVCSLREGATESVGLDLIFDQ